MNAVIILVGAGASFDAGMPLVAQLTEELRHRLPDVRDINGGSRPEFSLLFEAIAQHDDEVAKNYERFFEWIALMRQGQREPFCKLVSFKLEQHLVTAAEELAWGIKLPIWEILRSRHQSSTYQPRYFSRLGDFLPEQRAVSLF